MPAGSVYKLQCKLFREGYIFSLVGQEHFSVSRWYVTQEDYGRVTFVDYITLQREQDDVCMTPSVSGL